MRTNNEETEYKQVRFIFGLGWVKGFETEWAEADPIDDLNGVVRVEFYISVCVFTFGFQPANDAWVGVLESSAAPAPIPQPPTLHG